MRYLARSKLSRILVNNYALVWRVVFYLEYLFCQVRYDTSFDFEPSRKIGL